MRLFKVAALLALASIPFVLIRKEKAYHPQTPVASLDSDDIFSFDLSNE